MTNIAPQQSARYSAVSITLHWLIAFMLGGMIALGKLMHTSDGRPVEWMFQLHKSVGITILVLMIARLIWRLKNKPPALPADMKPLEKQASHWVHIGLYGLCFLLPITGWIMVSVSPFAIATVLYGTLAWPHLPALPELALETRQTLYPTIENLHELLSWGLILLFALHVLGAIKHELSDEEGVIKRMIPGLFGKTTPPSAPSRGAFTAFGSAALFFGLIAGSPVLAQVLKPTANSSPPAQSTETANWGIDYEASEIRFSGIHDGNDFTGIFENWTAQISWSENTLNANSANVSIDTSSAVTGNPLYDNTVSAAEWFNTSAFPNATVSLSNFSSTDTGYRGEALITIKERAVSVPFDFTLTFDGPDAMMSGTASLSREAFDLGQDSDSGGDWVSLEIDVSVTVKASRIGN